MNASTAFLFLTPLLALSLAHGGILSVSNSKGFDSNQLVDKNGVLLTDADPILVAIGTFASEPSTPMGSTMVGAGAYATLLGEFTAYGLPVGINAAGGVADRTGTFDFQDEQLVAGTGMEGKAIYVLVARGTILAGATEVAIIKTGGTFEAGDDVTPLPKLIGMGTGLGSTVIVGSDALFAIAASGADPSNSAAYSLAEVGGDPEIVVEEPVLTDLVDGSSGINFGSGPVGVAGVPKTFTVRNTGAADLTGLLVTVDGVNPGDFVVDASGMATSLAPAASTTFEVTFTAGALGARSAVLHIASNDADENPFDIDLSGIGAGVAPTDLVLSPDAVDENLASGTSVGTLTATDADVGDSFTYSLVAGAGGGDNGLFSIDVDQLKTAAVFDHEGQSSASIRVLVVDSFGLEYEEALTVVINDDRGEDADGDGVTEEDEEDVFGTSDTDPDSDGDGFEDGFEVLHGFDPASDLDGTGDRDGDGWADWLEVRLGTDPDVAGPGLDFAVYPNGAGDPVVRVGPGGTLLGFFVERSTTLDGAWGTVADYPAGLPLGQTQEWTDVSPPGSDEVFYRVGVYPLPLP